MLQIWRKSYQWIEVVHRSGEVLRIRARLDPTNNRGPVLLEFDDAARNFRVARVEDDPGPNPPGP